MKQGQDIRELATELKRQAASQVDYTANQGRLSMEMKAPALVTAATTQDGSVDPQAGNGSVLDEILSKVDLTEPVPEPVSDLPMVPHMKLDNVGAFPLRSIAHGQLSSHLKIPKNYYDRMLMEAPELLTENVNTWLGLRSDDQRMIRTMDGDVRAYLSSAYRRIDNLPLMIAAMQIAVDTGCKVASCSVTEETLYLKLTSEKLQGEIKVGDVVQGALVISNSEVGKASVKVEPMLIRLSCLNGMVMAATIKRRHIGRRTRLSDDDGVEQLLTDDTKKLDDAAFMAKFTDVVKGSMKEDLFNLNMDKIRGTVDMKVTAPVKDSVEVLAKRWALSETEHDQTLQTLIESGDLTQWGMSNAVTAMSQSVKSYDRASELEVVGGEIVQMDEKDWTGMMMEADRASHQLPA